METLAREAVEGTEYRVFRVHPDFTYDPNKPIVGVWADTMCTVFGVAGFTLELNVGIQIGGVAWCHASISSVTRRTTSASRASTRNASGSTL